MTTIAEASFWIGLLQIVFINLILSGDNAVVIALACRGIPRHQQRLGIALGAGAAIVLRIIFSVFVVELFAVPYLKMVGGILLFWIAVQLLATDSDDDSDEINAASTIFAAVRTVAIADAVMSLDNVIGIAAAAKGNIVLLALGLIISMPLIIYGSTLLLTVMGRFPFVVLLGGALIGWVAGDVTVSDPAIHAWLEVHVLAADYLLPGVAVVMTIAAAKFLSWRAARNGAGDNAGMADDE
jgi:YjbE family integral membrane protein